MRYGVRKKKELVLWGILCVGLILLYLLSSTDWIIKEKEVEVYPVSLIISDTSDDDYVNFRKGVDQAAVEYNVDVSFITLYEKDNLAQQMELVRREAADGAGAVILEPVDELECRQYLEENTFEQKPLLAVDSGKNKCSATLSYLKLTEYMIAPNKKEYLKKYDAELKEIENLRLEEEQNMA